MKTKTTLYRLIVYLFDEERYHRETEDQNTVRCTSRVSCLTIGH